MKTTKIWIIHLLSCHFHELRRFNPDLINFGFTLYWLSFCVILVYKACYYIMLSFFSFLFCKYVFSTNNHLIKGSALIYRHVTLLILVASLNRFLLVEISGTHKYSYLVIVGFFFKCVNVDDIHIRKSFLDSGQSYWLITKKIL